MEVRQSIEIAASAEQVWEVLTDPRRIRQWVSDAELTVEVDWRIGGRLEYGGDWHGTSITNRGDVLAIAPPARLQYSFWSSLSQTPDTPEKRSVITLELTRHDKSTALRVTQENIPTADAHGHVNFYWTMALDRIRRLAEGDTAEPATTGNNQPR